MCGGIMGQGETYDKAYRSEAPARAQVSYYSALTISRSCLTWDEYD